MTEPVFSEPVAAPEVVVPDHRASEPGPKKVGPTRIDPPKRSTMFGRKPRDPAPKPERERPSVPNTKGQFVKPLEETYAMLALGAAIYHPQLGHTIAQQAHDCAVAWDQLAHENEAVRRVLKGFLTTSAVGALVVAHAPIVGMAIAVGKEKKAVKQQEAEYEARYNTFAETPPVE